MVKPGYKQTEIGVIPEDWEVISFHKCFDILPNNTLSRAELNDNEGSVRNIHYGDILVKYDTILNCSKSSIPFIISPSSRLLSKPLIDGDIIIADTAEDETVGKAVEIAEIKTKSVVSGLHTIPCRAKNSNMFARGWLGFFINSSVYHNQLLPLITGTKVSAISKTGIANTIILIPPLAEQKRIAEALSDMDELISSLEKLIEKKKAIKQGAMQELLTGKRRLPGFSGEWKTARFGELFVICPNNAFTRDQLTIGGKIKNIHYGDILTKYGEYLDGSSASIPTLEKSLTTKKYPDNAFVQSGDVIVADTAEDLTVGKAVEIVNVCGKMLSGQHTFLCRPIIPFAPMYLGYYMNSADFHDQIIPFVTGTKVSSISKASLCSLIIRYPETPEQETIAEVLANIDNSIVALQIKLLKAQKIKQGMMQQLLTGKVRLG